MARKIFYCFLLSAIVCAGMVILVFTGIFDPSVFNLSRAASVFVLAAFFLTLFLAAFFCSTLWTRLRRRNSAHEKKIPVEAASDIFSGGNESAMLNYSPELLSHKIDELAELEAVEELEVVSPFLPALPMLSDDNESDDTFLELEEISNGRNGGAFLFSRPFSFFPGNPEMLQGIAYDVFYEENGIHYINDSIFDGDFHGKELNSDFAQLVESVINQI